MGQSPVDCFNWLYCVDAGCMYWTDQLAEYVLYVMQWLTLLL